MPSSVKHSRRPISGTFEIWNRRLHFYLGLYFLFFLWLFSLTGLLLNHSDWAQALGANQRTDTKDDRPIQPPRGDTDVDRARDIMRQLSLAGEINWPASQQPGTFAFNVSRPNDASQIRVDLGANRASMVHFTNSGVSAFRIFHTFSGSRYADTARRDWILTTVWVFAMDALAVGLLAMVFGSYYMWYRLKPRRRLGLVVLAAGGAAAGLVLKGLLGL
jgi:hypothetical protein